ncbi:MAG: MFS transporter [Deltaproteobacteria bacterium]|nr:MAG: MFS transporter [Deltaproteobacteria bacterium]
MLTSQQNRYPIRTLGDSLTLRIIFTSILIFVCYFIIGLQLAVVPGFVHLQLGYNAVLAGLAISAQYVATLLSRPIAGRISDSVGAKHTTRSGLLVCATSGVFFLLSAWLKDDPLASFCVLLLSRLILGFGESWVATGATIWGIGRVGGANTAQVISWSGIASYGALAIGAPVGVWLENNLNVGAIGVVSVVAALGGFLWASAIRTIPVQPGESLAFRQVFGKVFPYGLSLALGGVGFGTIASFITLYYASQHWQNAGLSLSLFGISFVAARLLFANTINKWGGYRVAIVSLAFECSGLILLWLASVPAAAQAGAALTGFGFSLVFPALGVEAVRNISAHNRGSALGVYTAFVDLSLGISGPIAGMIVFSLGYPPIFLFAAAMAGSSMALAIALYHRRAEPSNIATELSRLTRDTGSFAAARKGLQGLPVHHARRERRRLSDSSSPRHH